MPREPLALWLSRVHPIAFLNTFQLADQHRTDCMVNLYDDLGFSEGLVLILGALYVTVATIANFLASFVMDSVGRVCLLSMFDSALLAKFSY